MLSVLAVLAAALLFGTTGTSQALGPEGTTPLSVGVMRRVIGGTVLAAIAFTLAARAFGAARARLADDARLDRGRGERAPSGIARADRGLRRARGEDRDAPAADEQRAGDRARAEDA